MAPLGWHDTAAGGAGPALPAATLGVLASLERSVRSALPEDSLPEGATRVSSWEVGRRTPDGHVSKIRVRTDASPPAREHWRRPCLRKPSATTSTPLP